MFTASRHGIQRLEIGDTETDKNPRIITLENCVKITQENAPANLIHVVTKTGSLTLNVPTEEDLKRWVTALQNVAFKEKAGESPAVVMVAAPASHASSGAMEENNDLYCSSYGDGVFVINLVATETSQRCNLPAKLYKVSLAATELQLMPADEEKKVIAKWQYRYIRKYGYKEGYFTFEAGRKCDSGEGCFILDHPNPQEIHRCLYKRMQSLKNLLQQSLNPNSEESENQLSVAVSSMEAGSRSPISLFVSAGAGGGAGGSIDFDLSSNASHSFSSIRSGLPSPSSGCEPVSSVSTTSSSIQLLKHIPNKPPRKLPDELPLLPKRKHPIPGAGLRDDYERIQLITDAWKTLGIDDVKHTENVTASDLIEFSTSTTSSRCLTKKEHLLLNTKIRTQAKKLVEISADEPRDTDDDSDYAHLDHFRAASKPSATYKTVIPITIQPAAPSVTTTGPATPSSGGSVSLIQIGANKKPTSQPVNDDYEIIGNPDTNACRLADDSHLGYGVLRKATTIHSPTALNANKKFLTDAAKDEVLLKNSAILLTDSTSTATTTTSTLLLADDIDEMMGHHKYNGLDYAIVSKPKRV